MTDEEEVAEETAHESMVPSNSELIEALKRADRLIVWMSKYIANMAPGDYGSCYGDLNEHGIFMARLVRGE